MPNRRPARTGGQLIGEERRPARTGGRLLHDNENDAENEDRHCMPVRSPFPPAPRAPAKVPLCWSTPEQVRINQAFLRAWNASAAKQRMACGRSQINSQNRAEGSCQVLRGDHRFQDSRW